MAKDLQISLLLDFYGEVLGDKQREIIEDYYNSDLSLAEIAEDKNITRQGVRDSIKRSELALLELESKLNLFKRFSNLENKVELIIEKASYIEQNSNDKEICENAKYIIENVKLLTE